MNRLLAVLFFLTASVIGQEDLPLLLLSVGQEGVTERMVLVVGAPEGGVCVVDLVEDFGLWTEAGLDKLAGRPNDVKSLFVTTVRGDPCRRLWAKAKRINNARLKNGA